MASLSWSLLMLLLVVALIPACLWLTRRLQSLRPASGHREMAVLDQLALGPRERLVKVRLGDRVLVLGVTAQQVALVAELDSDLATAALNPATGPASRPSSWPAASVANALRRLV